MKHEIQQRTKYYYMHYRIHLLLLLSIIQFLIITYLLHQLSRRLDSTNGTHGLKSWDDIPPVKYHDDNGLDLSKPSASKHNTNDFNQTQSPSPDEIRLPENTTTVALKQPASNYQGVATTLMINSPKWFQRRYTAMISNILLNTPNDWAVQIFYIDSGQSQFGLDINPGLTRLSKMESTSHRIVFTKLPAEMVQRYGKAKKKLYWTDPWVWERMVADRVLVFGGNGALCSNSKRSLVDGTAMDGLLDTFDYIGTPWRNRYGQGGDGSISYRNRTAMLDAIHFKSYDGDQQEDLYFVTALADMNEKAAAETTRAGGRYRIATKEQTRLFGGAAENFTETMDTPMVLAGTLDKLDHTSRELILFLCPELKVIFPALHHPSCFGAHPNVTECTSYIFT